MSFGMLSASVRAWPPACCVALTSRLSARRAAMRLPNAGLQLPDHALDRLAVRARREGQRHPMLENGLSHIEHVINGGREPAIDQSAGARHQHQGLARPRAWSP